ncbi:hypothetical protein M4951_18685 [Blastopirellula sp. J2-11]|uniref:hypothetical protein n=1 Tax=Blastopirellula sp. J2-11 TaxID=2943192 RepID=UPI0021C5A810|nr:hypothetical protein [Blastopirellula sp. J2-11]UUO05395.1 hypothetical protein M4951_18685 [Blastopirellula sp. J2-11]
MKSRLVLPAFLVVASIFAVVAANAEAGLFGHHGCGCEPTCCAPEPTCCAPEPSCCDPCDPCSCRMGLFGKLRAKLASCCKPKCCESSCCGAEPTCCAPEPTCCAPEPTCCAPEPTCCAPEPSCCEPCCKKPCFLKRLFNHCKRSSCCEPTCCAPEPTCCG